MILFWLLVACAAGMALAQDVDPGRAIYHYGWYNALDIALFVLAVLQLRPLRKAYESRFSGLRYRNVRLRRRRVCRRRRRVDGTGHARGDRRARRERYRSRRRRIVRCSRCRERRSGWSGGVPDVDGAAAAIAAGTFSGSSRAPS